MAEKRESKRHRKRFCVKFGIDNERRISFTEDISPEGLFIQTPHILLPGTAVELDLILDDDSLIALEGQVMWAKRAPRGIPPRLAKMGMGVKITKIAQGAEAYGRLCEELASRRRSTR
jgi:Tfp pilus assembly protein PilZ